MPKKFIKRFMPDHQQIRNHKTLNRVFGNLLHDPNLLHMNRRSVSGAFFVGLLLGVGVSLATSPPDEATVAEAFGAA